MNDKPREWSKWAYDEAFKVSMAYHAQPNFGEPDSRSLEGIVAVALDAARRQGLDEAAKMCEDNADRWRRLAHESGTRPVGKRQIQAAGTCASCAIDIRALAAKAPHA